MALSVFDDRNAPPTERGLAEALGKASAAWLNLKEKLHRECDPLQEEWAFAGAQFGWSLRMKRGKRVIVYLTPASGHFLASFALGERACAAARGQRIAAGVLALIEKAPRYAEGRGVRIPVRAERETSAICRLALIKLEN